ncbi:primosomal protein N' [Patescibacteria group bacterium]|nr:MAG: primosomal protein N' [Patescibacteria group bacterium]
MLLQIIPARRMPFSLPFLDYAAPAELEARVKIGQLVKIPFRSREEFGIIKSIGGDAPPKKVRPILEIFYDTPLLSQAQLNFLEEISAFYGTPLSFLLKTNLPPLSEKKLKKELDKKNFRSGAAVSKKPKKPGVFYYADKGEKQKLFIDAPAKRGQTLIIAPELEQITEIWNLLSEERRAKCAAISGRLSEKQFFAVWMDIFFGRKNIVIGTRRALFLPWRNLTRVIIDDEANESHKSWDMAPRFHAKDAALFLAAKHGAALQIMCHTPSVETYFFAQKNVYKTKDAPKTFADSATIVDMCGERRAGNYTFISQYLRDKITALNGDAFIFLNRKGAAAAVGCRDCGNVIKCPSCGRSLVYHETDKSLRCHFCKTLSRMPPSCAVCRGVNMALYGIGTQLAENTLRKLAPDKRVIRIDSDDGELSELKAPGNKIIIGTQLAWNKIDWSALKLAAFLDADSSLFIPEFKIDENVWYLLRDAQFRLGCHSGLVPESTINPELIIQTGHPEYPVFSGLAKPANFYEQQIKIRQLLGFPPFNFLLKIYNSEPGEALAKSQAEAFLAELRALTRGMPRVNITGPLAAPFRRGKDYSQIILLKIGFANYKRDTAKISSLAATRGWKVDPNPNTLLAL